MQTHQFIAGEAARIWPGGYVTDSSHHEIWDYIGGSITYTTEDDDPVWPDPVVVVTYGGRNNSTGSTMTSFTPPLNNPKELPYSDFNFETYQNVDIECDIDCDDGNGNRTAGSRWNGGNDIIEGIHEEDVFDPLNYHNHNDIFYNAGKVFGNGETDIDGAYMFAEHLWRPDEYDVSSTAGGASDAGLFDRGLDGGFEMGGTDIFHGIHRSAYNKAQDYWDNYVIPNYLNGTKDLAYYYLGRVVHLLEDMSSVPHVHNELHGVVKNNYEEDNGVVDNYTVWSSYNWAMNKPNKENKYNQPIDYNNISDKIIDEWYCHSPSAFQTTECDSVPTSTTQGWPDWQSRQEAKNAFYQMPPLFRIFYSIAETTDDFPADMEAGDIIRDPTGLCYENNDIPHTIDDTSWLCVSGDEFIEQYYNDPNKKLKDLDGNVITDMHYNVEEFSRYIQPIALRHVAALYQLFWEETHPPTVSITFPANSSIVTGTTTVTVSAQDDIRLKKVSYYLDNSTIVTRSVNAAPFSWTWDTATISNGPHTITAIAYNAAGNESLPSTITVNVNNPSSNNTPNTPTFFGQFKSDGTGIGFGEITDERIIALKGDVTDPDGDWASLEVEIRLVGTAFYNSPNCSSPSESVAPGGTAVVTCDALGNGQYHWQARAKDSYGAVSDWFSAGGGNLESDADFIISAGSGAINYPPSVTVISPNGGDVLIAGSSYEIKWIATDDQNVKLVTLYYSEDGGNNWTGIMDAVFLDNPGSYQWTVPNISSTTVRVKAIANDGELTDVDISDGNLSIAESCNLPSTPELYDSGLWTMTGNYNIFWQDIGSATSYILQESTSSSFSSVAEYQTSTASKYISGKANGFYYYRVKTVNDCGDSGWSNIVDMEVRVNAPPNIPSNPDPYDGKTNVSRAQLTLSWSGGDPDGSVEYAVRFGTDPNPGFYAGFGAVSGTSYQIPFTLNPGTKYYWGIKARDDEWIETESPIWSFTTEYSYADLVPTNLTVDGAIAPDADVTLNLTVQNQGTFTASSVWAYFYYSSTSGAKEQQLARTLIPELAPGEQATVSQTVTLTNLQAGQSYIDAWIDTQNYFIEGDTSNNYLSQPISYQDGNAPVIDYLNLQGATIFRTGYEYSIVYEVSDDVGVSTANLYYSIDNGTTWIEITTGFVPRADGSTNSYRWMIPSDMPLTDQLQVKMVVWDTVANSAETVAGPYTIVSGVAPTVTILSPNGGEVWEMGSTQEIRWDVSAPNGISGMSLLFYYPNRADVIANITSNTTGSYTWALRDNFSTNQGKIRIRVTDLNGNESEDWSDDFFKIRDTSAPPSVPWTIPEVVTEVPSSDLGNKGNSSPQVAVDSSGAVHMVYLYSQDISGTPRVITKNIMYKKLVGDVWSAPTTVYTITQETYSGLTGYYGISALQIAADSQGFPHIIWQTDYSYIAEGNKQDIFYTYFDGSEWTEPQNLSDGMRGSYNVNMLAWTNKTNMPVAKMNAASAVVNEKLYILGGTSNYEYDPSTNTWTQKADAPGIGIYEGGAAVINNKIYAIGDTFDNIVKTYDPSTNTWTTGAQVPASRRYMGVVAVNGKLYAIGGISGGNPSNTVEEYDPATNTWSTKTSMPTPRWGHAVAVVDGLIYVIGGAAGYALDTVEVYDPAADTWTTKEKPIAANWPRTIGAVAVVVGGRIYLMGGGANSVYEYDPVTNTWLPMNSMQYQHDYAVAEVIGSKIYIAGGYDGTNTLNFVEEASLSSELTGARSYFPTIAIDTLDTVHIAWVDGSYWEPDDTSNLGFSMSGQVNVYYRTRDITQDWSPVSQLTTDGASWTSIASDILGNVHLAYQEGLGSIASISWNGTEWSSPTIAT